jgi:hypothetical protein
MKHFFQWPYVKRHFASKGTADIVCIRGENGMGQVAFVQCKYSKHGMVIDEKGPDSLIETVLRSLFGQRARIIR